MATRKLILRPKPKVITARDRNGNFVGGMAATLQGHATMSMKKPGILNLFGQG